MGLQGAARGAVLSGVLVRGWSGADQGLSGAMMTADPTLTRGGATYEDGGHVHARERARVAKPAGNVRERVPRRNIVHQQRARGAAVVAAGDRAEALLASGVPNLQLDDLPADLDESRAELDADRVRRAPLEGALDKLVQQARLARA